MTRIAFVGGPALAACTASVSTGPNGEIILPTGRSEPAPPIVRPMHEFTVRVRDETGARLPGIRVSRGASCDVEARPVRSTPGFTNARGEALIRTNTTGEGLLLSLTGPGFVPGLRWVPAANRVPSDPLELTLRRGITLRVPLPEVPDGTRVIVQAADGIEPRRESGPWCSWVPNGWVSGGVFDGPTLPPGRYLLALQVQRPPDLLPPRWFVPVELRPTGSVVVDWRPAPTGNLEIGGIPAKGECVVRIAYRDGSLATGTRHDGVLTLPAGKVDLQGWCWERMLRTGLSSAEIQPGRTAHAELTFEPSPTLRGRVTPGRGFVVARPIGDVWTSFDLRLRGPSDREGNFSLGPLLHDAYRVVAFDPNTGFQSEPTEIASGSGPVTLTMVDRRQRLQVLDAFGLRIPARDVTISGGWVEDREERLEYRPGSDSQFPEHYLSAGPRTVYLPPGPLGGERGVVVAPDPRIAEGQVIDQETGEPLPSALVRRVMADLADHDFDTDWGFFPEFDRFTVTADAAGRFRYPWAIDGTPVLVTHPGFGRRLVLLSRNPGQRIGLDRTPSISLSVASDALLSCVAVQNPASRHEGLRYVVIPRGESVNVDGLLEGRWTLHLGCDPDSRPVRTLDVQAGRRYPVALEARRSP